MLCVSPLLARLDGAQRTVIVRKLTMNSLPVPRRAQMLTAY